MEEDLDKEDNGFEGGVEQQPTVVERRKNRLSLNRLSRRESLHDPTDAEALVQSRRVPDKKPDDSMKEFIIKAVKTNRYCKSLEEDDLKEVLEHAEFFIFQDGDTVARQGCRGNHFFVTYEGSFDMLAEGKVVNRRAKGDTFGTTALLHNCPWTFTVVATDVCKVWAVPGTIFRKVLQEHAQKHFDKHHGTLDQIWLFGGLTGVHKDRISRHALLASSYEAGERVVKEGQIPTAIYVVQSGALSAYTGGTFNRETGELDGGTFQKVLRAGDCFGDRAALYQDVFAHTVIADEPATVVCIGIPELKELLGENLAEALERNVLLTVMSMVPVINHLPPRMRRAVADAGKITKYGSEAPISFEGVHVLAVLEGQITGVCGDKELTLTRQQWCQDTAFDDLEVDALGKLTVPGASVAGLKDLKAGPNGARIACLTRVNLHQIEKECIKGLNSRTASKAVPSSADLEHSVEYLRKAFLMKKVPIFRGLSPDQMDDLLHCMELKTLPQNSKVYEQGECGDGFFLIAAGEVEVLHDGSRLHTLGKGAAFGERSLLLNEKRPATVQVLSTEAKLWSINQEQFHGFMSEASLDLLKEQVQFGDNEMSLKSLKHVRWIGVGACGSVRLVEHPRSGCRFALKRVRKKDGQVPTHAEREKSLLTEVQHPFVVRLVATFETSASAYLLTELVTGGMLYMHITERMGCLSRKHAQFYIGTLILVLEALHEASIVYRDLKPDNVMLDSQGYLKLVDFGLSKRIRTGDECERAYSVVGTPIYVAPEVVKGHGYGREVDIWSLGIMLYELVCGKVPFGEDASGMDEILVDVLEQPLNFPKWYNDIAGKKVIQGMLCRETDKRLGAGLLGWGDIRSSKFFTAGHSAKADLFSKLWARTLPPPIVPDREEYTTEDSMKGKISCSDSEEFGSEAEDTDNGDDVLQTFKRLDTNCDGLIDRGDMKEVLRLLDPETFTDDIVGMMFDAVGKGTDESVDFKEFCDWIFTEGAQKFRDAVQLDVHP
mmetsp:Transcript_157880/g.290938  ORF Transcript_157880/g.290938 Transcript_157880/m.290938 type:complete len:1002 (+) Transcript_157880:102-3107(+)